MTKERDSAHDRYVGVPLEFLPDNSVCKCQEGVRVTWSVSHPGLGYSTAHLIRNTFSAPTHNCTVQSMGNFIEVHYLCRNALLHKILIAK